MRAMELDRPREPLVMRERPLPQPAAGNILVAVSACGVCRTDLHVVDGEMPNPRLPIVPGHEIVGRVIEVGSDVTRYQPGDSVAVGCMVDSCLDCDQCRRGEEQLCRFACTQTYNDRDRITREPTYGGYSKHLVVREEFALRVPAGLDLARTAPLLCAGITTYSPLRTWKAGPGSRVGVIGLGGLGHMAVKLAAGMGCEVTVLSRTRDKEADALALGAKQLLVSTDPEAMQAAGSTFDLIIDTVPVRHDLNPYLPLLDVDGTLVIVGQLGPVDELSTLPLLLGRRRVSGSPIGGIAETQHMLDFCAEKNILPDCEMIRMEEINEAFVRLERADVRYRFVIDMASFQQ
jgi:alcohol dehydrogenase (NADP+)